MANKTHRILVINPGSTSTKVAVFEDDTLLCQRTIRHSPEEFAHLPGMLDQKGMRTELVESFLKDEKIDINSLSAVVGRGGLIKHIPSGTYEVNDAMLADLGKPFATGHASSLGGVIAREISAKVGIPAFTVDPVTVNEMEPVAKISGNPLVPRRGIFHALNTKAIARRAAADLGGSYADFRFILVHLGGGVSVGAHRYGRVIDVNDALYGEGPFSPERSGGVPLYELIQLCYSGDYTEAEVLSYLNRRGGLMAYLGTTDFVKIEQMIADGDEKAARVVDAMVYQIAKEVGAMHVVLDGEVDAIVMTGGLAYSQRFTGLIRERTRFIAPALVYPGEDEMIALAQGALRVLNGEERAAIYK